MSRSAVFRYKGQVTDPQAVAKALGVHGIITGRMVQRGDMLSISVEFVDAHDGRLLWGEQYNRKLADLLTVQEEISRDMYEKLSSRLAGGEEKHVAKRATANPEAYQLYLKGLYNWNRWNEDGFKKAIENYQAAVERDPNYAVAYTGLADSYILLSDLGLKGSLIGIALPQIAFSFPLTIVILRPFFKSIPTELEDAAKIDGIKISLLDKKKEIAMRCRLPKGVRIVPHYDRTELVEHLYEQDFDRDSNTVEVFIGRLRKKLPLDLIKTVRGLGYRLSDADDEV